MDTGQPWGARAGVWWSLTLSLAHHTLDTQPRGYICAHKCILWGVSRKIIAPLSLLGASSINFLAHAGSVLLLTIVPMSILCIGSEGHWGYFIIMCGSSYSSETMVTCCHGNRSCLSQSPTLVHQMADTMVMLTVISWYDYLGTVVVMDILTVIIETAVAMVTSTVLHET